MSEIQKIKIGSFLFERKGRYKPDDQHISGLKRIEKIDFQGSFHIGDKPSKTGMILIKPGDFVISGINVTKGAMGIYSGKEDVTATIHYSSYTFDDKIINVGYFKRFLKSKIFIDLLKAQVKGGIKTEIKPKHILPLNIFLPDRKKQDEIVKQFENIEDDISDLSNEITRQQTLLKHLRQSILQDAVSGKLTEQWRKQHPDVEPAADLLKRIKAEKDRLVKEKKIKKQKPLPPITKDEIPFDLPESWVWCRLGEYALFERGKFSIRPRNDPSCFCGEYPFIQIGSLDNTGSVISTFKQTLNDKGFAASKLFEKGTVMVAIVGGTIGNLGVLGKDMCFPDSIVGVRPMELTSQDYILMLLQHYQPSIRQLAYQMSGQPNIKLSTLNNLVCALPPLYEQKVIVTKSEKLLANCDQLETQITQSQQHSEMLMQAVLKEAFEG